MKTRKIYAYLLPGGERGITKDWSECEKYVSGVSGARYRAFSKTEEASAWLELGAPYEIKEKTSPPKLETGIYFDAGTGRGLGVEISVTDERGKNLLHESIKSADLNKHGKHLIRREVTNNYGELLAMKHAMVIAKKKKIKKIFGDSKLVINYWSKGIMNEKKLPKETVQLVNKVAVLRTAFETWGGVVGRVSGDYNPADLGFHR